MDMISERNHENRDQIDGHIVPASPQIDRLAFPEQPAGCEVLSRQDLVFEMTNRCEENRLEGT
jgi:hypothetical protein